MYGNSRRPVENWHYDKYRDPHEFPILDLSSDDGSQDAINSTSSGTLSNKLPQISDEKYRQILHRKNEIKKKNTLSNISNKMNDVPTLAFKEKSNLLSLKGDDKNNNNNNQHMEETKENVTAPGILLTSSTPKVNTFLSKSNDSIKIDKKLSPFLNDAHENNGSNISELIKALQAETLKKSELETNLYKKDIQIKNFETEVVKLTHDNSTMLNKNNELNSKINLLNDENKELNLKASEFSTDSENFKKLHDEFERAKLLLSKERDMNKSLILNYDNQIKNITNENLEILKSVEFEKNQVNYWKQNCQRYEGELMRVKDELKTIESKNEKLTNDLEESETKIKNLNTTIKTTENHYQSLTNKYDELVVRDKDIKTKYDEIIIENDSYKLKIKDLENKENEWSLDYIKLKTEYETNSKIQSDELNNKSTENDNLNKLNKSLTLDNNKLLEEINKIKGVSSGSVPISKDSFKNNKYELLEMNLLDELSIIELQNIIKNILSSFDIKFTDLKNHIIFIRDFIFVFFDEIHSILHCSNNGNMVVIDKSIKLDRSDTDKFKLCMKILLEDVKTLKGIKIE